MKKLLILLFFALTLNLSGQVLSGVVASISASSSTPVITEEEYQAVYDELSDVPSKAIAEAQNAMVKSLVDGGYWARMDLFYVMAQKAEADALIMWLDPDAGTYDLDEVGAGNLTFTSYEGFTGDGTNVLTTNWDQQTNGSNFSQYNATIGLYARKNVDAVVCFEIGAIASGGEATQLAVRYSGDLFLFRNNQGTSTTVANADGRGFFMSTVRTITDTEGYKNGASLTTNGATLSWVNMTLDLYIVGRNNNGTTDRQSLNQVSIVMLMNEVSDAEATAINTIIETYMDAIGKGVE